VEVVSFYSPVAKSVPKRYTLGLAYAANTADVGKALDGHIDFMSADALEDAAWEYLRKGKQIGLFHQDNTFGHAEVVESYIYRGPNWTIPVDDSEYVIKSGDWMLGALWDDIGFDLVQKKLVNGWSPQGRGRREIPSADSLTQLQLRSVNA